MIGRIKTFPVKMNTVLNFCTDPHKLRNHKTVKNDHLERVRNIERVRERERERERKRSEELVPDDLHKKFPKLFIGVGLGLAKLCS